MKLRNLKKGQRFKFVNTEFVVTDQNNVGASFTTADGSSLLIQEVELAPLKLKDAIIDKKYLTYCGDEVVVRLIKDFKGVVDLKTHHVDCNELLYLIEIQ